MRTIKLDDFDKKLKIEVEYSEFFLGRFINKSEFEILLYHKNQIDKVSSQKVWDKIKKLTNDYELIHLPNRKFKSESIALYNPLSRSYFKLWEIIFDFKLFNEYKNNIVIASLAEGPGGFIEAINNYRKTYFNSYDHIYGITLKSENKEVPGWNKAARYLKSNKNIDISYGRDMTGNLYNLDNILYFRDYIYTKEKKYVDIITADGGFDFSIDFNNQEQLSHKLIFCEIVTALTVQALGGKFICKFFFIFSELSMSFLYLLNSHYETLYITKPLTSRTANSEKYIVCSNFKGIDSSYLDKLHKIVQDWNTISINDWQINSIFKEPIPDDFKSKIIGFNTKNSDQQIQNIKKTLDYIDNNKNIEDTKVYQTKLAKEWCKKYSIKINQNSIFIN